ncbi:redox-sensitive bicupin YhaK (pirin superfamily) [Kitasatospora sp. GP30]|uniref:pirin family protein n=1 Tax=Kitasatospora sp. GP30 TaxID=3035084 RepID=UPI000C7154E9|nr:pirin-like bicupin family protein [Kitasatospora sp. GP30]MDH6144319.1 redox-sensitive bicupin YhaK (pirin superfamily) [Kitasatospora sp. GP30]
MASVLDVRRAEERFHTRTDWLDSRHSFSFSRHWDPANTHFGLLLVSNDDVVAPGTGFDTHPHRDMEIVTWVLEGSLVHQDSEGHNGVIYPGLAQRMSAGTGILHSEKNDSWTLTGRPEHQTPVRFLQMWTIPDAAGIQPGYEQLDINDELARGGWVTLASGMPEHTNQRAIAIRQQHAALHVARIRPGETLELPTSPFAHLFIARGSAELEGAGPLGTGDAARITGSDGRRITGGPDGAEALVWEMTAAVTVG